MTNLRWTPIDFEPELYSLGENSSVLLHSVSDKKILLIYDVNVTSCLFFSGDGGRLILDYAETISSKNEIKKITSNNNYVYMIDINHDIYYLEFKAGNNTSTFNISSINNLRTGEITLSWRHIHKSQGCSDMIGVMDGLVILHRRETLCATLYKTTRPDKKLVKLSECSLGNCNLKNKYFMILIDGEIANAISNNIFKNITSTCDQVLFIVQPSQILFMTVTASGLLVSKPYAVDFDTNSIIKILPFNTRCIILIICKSGLVASFRLGNSSSKIIECNQFQLPSRVFAVTQDERSSQVSFLWSDVSSLYVSIVNENQQLTNHEVNQKIRGVMHFIKIDSNLLAITRNGFLYQTGMTSVVEYNTALLSSNEVLSRICDTGKLLETMIEELTQKEDLINGLEILKNLKTNKEIFAIIKGNKIIVKNGTTYTFKKDVWKFKWEGAHNDQRVLEIKNLDKDIIPGDDICIQLRDINHSKLKIYLICELMKEAVIFIELETRVEDVTTLVDDVEFSKFCQYLKENYNFST